MSRRWAAVRAWTLVVASVVALAACTSNRDRDGGSDEQVELLPGPSEAAAEYEGRTAELTLPEGVVWLDGLGPNRDVNGNVQDEPVVKGAGSAMADLYWVCAWRWEVLTQYDKDPDRAELALQNLEQIKQMAFYRELGNREEYYDEFERAALGDLAQMQAVFDAACDYLVFAEPS